MDRAVQKIEQQEPGRIDAHRDVLGVHEEKHTVIVVGGEKILVGEAKHAGIVVQGGTLIVRTEPLPVLEGGGQAVLAGGSVDHVPAAERKEVDGVGNIAGGAGGEESAVSRGFLWEGGRQEPQVGFVSAVCCVVAASVAGLPLSSGERQEKEEEEDSHGHCAHVPGVTFVTMNVTHSGFTHVVQSQVPMDALRQGPSTH